MIETDVGSLQVGDTFWYHGVKFEMSANGGALYVQAVSVSDGSKLHITHDEDVEVEASED
jgi:hypothetical protein